MNNSLHCNEQRIRCFLRDELSDVEEDALETHLNKCTTCRQRLEESTAETAVWTDASEFLRDEPFDVERLSDLLGPTTDPDSQVDLSIELQQIVGLLAPTDDPEKLGRIGRYEVAGIVGTGGMGIVLKALDVSLNRYVAIKVLAPHLASSGAARTRFEREAQAAAAVVNDNVLAIHGVDSFNGLPYLVMPYIRGVSLEARLRQQGSLSLTDILRIGTQTASGLAAAHAQGLVHRDIKPSNIMLTDGVARVAITDFGLARTVDDASLTRTGMIAGTPQYMSPEQARGDSVGHASDLFSLGSVIYAMCTGRPPFRAETSYAVLRRITDAEPRRIRDINPEIPPWLAAIVAKLHEKKAESRFTSASEVADLLEQCLAHVQQPMAIELPHKVKRLADCSRLEHETDQARFWIAGSVALIALTLFLLAAFGLVQSLGNSATTEQSKTPAAANSVVGTADDVKQTSSQQQHDVAAKSANELPTPDDPLDALWDDTIWQELDQLDSDLIQLEYSINSMSYESAPAPDSTDGPLNKTDHPSPPDSQTEE